MLGMAISLQAQVCTPDTATLPPGYFPAQITDGNETVIYNHVVTVVVPQDTIVQMFPVPIDSIVVTGIDGLPGGLFFNCSPGSCGIAGGSKGCILLEGRPDIGTAGSYPLTVVGTVYTTLLGAPFSVRFSQFYDTLQIGAAPMGLSAAIDAGTSCVGLGTQFQDYSQGVATSWSWDFGDGSGTSSMEKPVYTYATAGSFNVKLVVSNSTNTDSTTEMITVGVVPTASASADQDTACMGTMINLTATGADGNQFRWKPSSDLTNVVGPVTAFMVPSDTTKMFEQHIVYLRNIDTNTGCSSVDSVILTGENCATGIQGLFDGNEVYAFPNPAHDQVTVVFESNRRRKVELSLLDLSGRMIFSDRKEVEIGSNQLQLHLGDLSPGYYVLRMQDGRESFQQPLIVE